MYLAPKVYVRLRPQSVARIARAGYRPLYIFFPLITFRISSDNVFIIYKGLVISDRNWVGFLRNRFVLSACGILGHHWVGMRLRRIIAKCPIIVTHIWAPGLCANI